MGQTNTGRHNSNMKLFVISCLVAAVACAPQDIAITRYDSSADGAIFNYAIAADNGIAAEASGSPGVAGQSNIQGQYSFTSPEGVTVQIVYQCDEAGCRYDSPILPVAPPAPAHVAELIRISFKLHCKLLSFIQICSFSIMSLLFVCVNG